MSSILRSSIAVIEPASHGPVCRAPSTGLKHLQGPPNSVISVSVLDFYLVVEGHVYRLGLIFSHMSMCVCRWWAGEWEACSATCGPHGEKKRTVLCIQTMGSDEQALPTQDCQHLLKPKTLVSCNRDILCPSDWTVGNWSEVSRGVKRDTGVIRASSALSPILLINQSKVTGDEVHSGLFSAFPTSQYPISLVFHSYKIFLSSGQIPTCLE